MSMKAEEFKLEAFSEANVTKLFLAEPKGIVSKIVNFISKQLYAKVEFYVPKVLYLKAELICEVIEGEISEEFKVHDLIRTLAYEILDHYVINGNPMHLWEQFRIINNSTIVNQYREDKQTKYQKISVSFPKKDLFELELLVKDTEDVRPREHYFYLTVERLLKLQFYNLMSELLHNTQESVVEKIIKTLKED